jgi:hypothetical protein
VTTPSKVGYSTANSTALQDHAAVSSRVAAFRRCGKPAVHRRVVRSRSTCRQRDHAYWSNPVPVITHQQPGYRGIQPSVRPGYRFGAFVGDFDCGRFTETDREDTLGVCSAGRGRLPPATAPVDEQAFPHAVCHKRRPATHRVHAYTIGVTRYRCKAAKAPATSPLFYLPLLDG